MAVPRAIRDKNIERIKFVEDSADSFDARVDEIDNTIFRNIVQIINSLDTKNGKIKQTSANIKKTLRSRTLKNAILTPAYIKSVNAFVGKFNQVREKNDAYFKSLPDNA